MKGLSFSGYMYTDTYNNIINEETLVVTKILVVNLLYYHNYSAIGQWNRITEIDNSYMKYLFVKVYVGF